MDEFDWDAIRNEGITPLNGSKLSNDKALRSEFLGGLELLRLHGPKAKPGAKVLPQMLRLADTLNAGAQYNGVLEPRRSSKTTGIFGLALGRVRAREEYKVVYTMATKGLKVRKRFQEDVRGPLERLWPDVKDRPFKLNNAGGSESVTWLETGSVLAFVSPNGDSFRSDAWDLIIVDEAGEASPGMTDDLLTGALATMDTRPDPQFIAAGTAGAFRSGNLLWDVLEQGRLKDRRYSILEYAADPGTSVEDIETWDTAAALLALHHPGVDTLTTLDRLQGNYDALGPNRRESFLAEYLSIFGTGSNAAGIFNLRQWASGAIEGEKPEPPRRFALGIAVHQLQTSACIVAAWREDGHPRLLVLAHEPRVEWLVKRTHEIATKYRAPVAHDSLGPVTTEAEELERMRPGVKLHKQTFPQVKTAAALMVKEIEGGRVGHWDQAVLNTAVQLARKRSSSRYSGWALGRGVDEDDILAIEAGSMALRLYDELQQRPALKPVSA